MCRARVSSALLAVPDVLCRSLTWAKLWAGTVSILVLSMLCPSRMLSWSSGGGEAELDRWAQTFRGVPCSSARCNQVEPPSCHQWMWSQALQLSDLITDFNSCCLQLNYPVSRCTMPSELFGGWILTSGLYLLRCCLLCLFHTLISSCPWVGALGVLVDTVIMLYPALFFYI